MLRESAAGGQNLAMDNPSLTGHGHINKNKKPPQSVTLLFEKTVLTMGSTLQYDFIPISIRCCDKLRDKVKSKENE
jgi:hypothetical protein